MMSGACCTMTATSCGENLGNVTNPSTAAQAAALGRGTLINPEQRRPDRSQISVTTTAATDGFPWHDSSARDISIYYLTRGGLISDAGGADRASSSATSSIRTVTSSPSTRGIDLSEHLRKRRRRIPVQRFFADHQQSDPRYVQWISILRFLACVQVFRIG